MVESSNKKDSLTYSLDLSKRKLCSFFDDSSKQKLEDDELDNKCKVLISKSKGPNNSK